MLTRLSGVALPLAFVPVTDELADERPEVNSHTFIGLGLMAAVIIVIWLIRRLRA
jgi:hypothetical protein